MKRLGLATAAALIAAPALAQEHRELGAHEHGVSKLEVAIEGDTVAIDIHSPGVDIVGFEHEAESSEDQAAVGVAVLSLAQPDSLFKLPEDAGCYLVEVMSHIHDHAFQEEHAHEEGEEHGEHEEHAKGEEHDPEEHDEHAGGEDHDHEGEHGEHTEFHATYKLRCTDPTALTAIDFPFFSSYPNAREIEIQYVTDTDAAAAEITGDAPLLELN
ncbi:DUF2796 domain-containing protein [Pseudoruegeria sp. HB172150]|uniref:zinc uptake protein ZrgA n=1 Tax=Pseudoruegeria sp. HB172150 TaxID=2721164 RepID=UPI001555EC0B|nr:DUF2796 domain-containing protein [Pseudoruegeria sp. HB172150]